MYITIIRGLVKWPKCAYRVSSKAKQKQQSYRGNPPLIIIDENVDVPQVTLLLLATSEKA